MKRFLLLLFVITFVLIFVGCSGDTIDDDYINPNALPITYDGKDYAGIGFVTDSSSPRINDQDYTEIQVNRPTVKGFEADGCFVLSGSVTYTGSNQYVLVEVTNMSVAAPASYYWVSGSYQKRIWLRSGLGDYKISLYRTYQLVDNLNYTGALLWWSYSRWLDTTYGQLGIYNFFVKNTRNEDGSFYYPSGPVQSDDSQIMSIAEGLVAGKTDEASKVKALHDFVVTNLEYDDASLEAGQRKKQDALSSLNNEVAVCEGYALLFSALARSVGIRSKYITGYAFGNLSAGHAWSGIEVDNAWSLVDATWDDTANPNNLIYTYFMRDEAFFATEHTWESDSVERSPAAKDVVYELKGYPRGSY